MDAVEITPSQVALPATGLLIGTLGRAGLEAVATIIVRMQQEVGADAWEPMVLGKFTAFIFGDVYAKRLCENPIWMHCLLHGMAPILEQEFVTGWVNGEADSIGVVTPKFLAADDPLWLVALEMRSESCCRRHGEATARPSHPSE